MSKNKFLANHKIIPFSHLSEIVSKWKKDDLCLVFTNGCFDLLHSGHVWYLKKASTFGDILIVGLNSDSSISRLKGPARPILPQSDRAYVLSAMEMVDHIIIFDEATPKRLIKEICPDVLVKGGDYKKEDIVGHDIVLNNGGKVEVVRFLEGKSTTNIVNGIKEK